MPTKKTRLGLDIGTNSIGWWLYEIDDDGNVIATVKAGVRIFANGRNPKSYSSLNEDRRSARSARRRRDRYLQRRQGLLKVLEKHKLMPAGIDAKKQLVGKDPYELRSNAATEELDPYDVGRAIFHINQRRGFKSNRKVDRTKGTEGGPVHLSIKDFKRKLVEGGGDRTVGQHLWEIRKQGGAVRARRTGEKRKDLYEYYSDREMLEEEFNRIWETQEQKSETEIYSQEAKKEIRKLVFSQRPLKPAIIGKCTLMPDEDRINKSAPIFQRFRILQEVNNLRFADGSGKYQPLPAEVRHELIHTLEATNKVKFKKISKMLDKHDVANARINFDGIARDKLDGDLTAYALTRKRKDEVPIDKNEYRSWGLAKQQEFVNLLESEDSDNQVLSVLTSKWSFSEEIAESCLRANLPERHGNLCEKAIIKMLPFLEEGKRYDEAVAEAGLGSHTGSSDDTDTGPTLKYLPNYSKLLGKYCQPRKKEDEDKPHLWRITNPTVHIALNQLRNVVNDVVRKYGNPCSINIELARDLPQGKLTREKIQKQQKERQQANETRKESLADFGLKANRSNIRLLQLWDELDDDKCVYCGGKISVGMLFSGQTDVDHILPFSRTLDDGLANKTVCCADCNKQKSNKTPYEAFGTTPGWSAILARANALGVKGSKILISHKAWRFHEDAMALWEEKHGFLTRQLPETHYILRASLEYLKKIVGSGQVIPIPGTMTGLLRKHWGMNSVLGGMHYKNRHDHRNHAVDAAIVGSLSRALHDQLSQAAAKGVASRKLFSEVPVPMESYRQKIKKFCKTIIVSHKTKRTLGGQLHNDTAMGVISGPNQDGRYLLGRRIELASMRGIKKIEKILSQRIRDKILDLFADVGVAGFPDALEEYCRRKNIFKVKVAENFHKRSIVLVSDRNNNTYKAYKLDGNHCYSIYENTSNLKWNGEIISRFHANQPNYIPQWQQEFPNAKEIMRIYKNDTLAQPTGNKLKHRYFVVQSISNGIIRLVPHNQANADSRDRDPEDDFSFVCKSPDKLRSEGFLKVNISAGGFVSGLKLMS